MDLIISDMRPDVAWGNKELLSTLLTPAYVESIKERIYDEKAGEYDYSRLSNLAMIYLFAHQKKNAFESKKHKTVKEYISELLMFLQDVQNTVGDVRNLDRRQMEAYQETIVKKYKRTTAARKITIIKGFLKWLYKVKYLDKDITIDMAGASVRVKDRPDRSLQTHEIQKVIDHFHDNVKVVSLIALLATTGLRIAEISKAIWGDLEWDDEVGGYFLKVIGKGDKLREAYIHEEVLDLLREYRKRVGLSDRLDPSDKSPLYPNNHGGFYNSNALSAQLNSYLEAAGVRTEERKITAHWFRHYFARQADIAGASITDIQRTLGHESLLTTQGYLDRLTSRRLNVGRMVKLRIKRGEEKDIEQ